MDLNLEKNYEDYRIKEYEVFRNMTKSGVKCYVFVFSVFEVMAIFLLCIGCAGCDTGDDASFLVLILSLAMGVGMFFLVKSLVREELYDLRKLEENLEIEKGQKE